MHAARKMDTTVFTEKWEGVEENNVPPRRQGQERTDIQSGGRGEAGELQDLIQMSVPLPGARYQI